MILKRLKFYDEPILNMTESTLKFFCKKITTIEDFLKYFDFYFYGYSFDSLYKIYLILILYGLVEYRNSSKEIMSIKEFVRENGYTEDAPVYFYM